MEEREIEKIYRSYRRRLKDTPLSFTRFLYEKINWNDRLIGIKGARGVGKTTLMLQYIKRNWEQTDCALYVSLDNLWFSNHSLDDLVEYHYTHGGTHLFLDEIHRYPYWQTMLKNLNDDYPDLHIAYTGSSMLEIDLQQGDLSRRQMVYQLVGLSFREFLEFECGLKIRAYSLEELLQDHVAIASNITEQVKILPLFEKYLRTGYYPFYKNTCEGYDFRLQEVVRQVIESDLPAVEDIQYVTIQKVKKMLMILAERVPHTPKMSELYKELETNREQGLKMLYALERGGLLSLLTTQVKNYKSLSRPDKIYLDNPNLMYALSPNIDIGTLRETFFFNQLNITHELLLPQRGDFYVDRHYLFEVGGRTKTFEQIKDISNSFLAVDGTEIGHHNRIPLWIFGLLY
ncbi:ATP-binding protein [Bacteroides sp. GM023]|uniref:ATP-binding protein n=1 Tax=Bacteroides sp. GM023 TaxID=2723058 RepID=UPI00168A98FB|nr:AAA family ATPase [Bacteroides sp. GM023]MBD3588432.1 ATP-binding protein [Bacteroides sp. GM023]